MPAPYVVTLTDLVPTPRADGGAWTTILIQEAPSPTGPWVDLETVLISNLPGGLDADPLYPLPRTVTTDIAQLEDGWYRVVFSDALGSEQLPTLPIHNAQEDDAIGWRPTVQQVANYIRARTKDSLGKELGTFTATTRPNGGDVEMSIDNAVEEIMNAVSGITGEPLPTSHYEEAQDIAALRAAMIVESSFFPEQIQAGRSNYDQLNHMWEGDRYNPGRIDRLVANITGVPADTGGPGEGAPPPGDSYYGFPPAIDWDRRPM